MLFTTHTVVKKLPGKVLTLYNKIHSRWERNAVAEVNGLVFPKKATIFLPPDPCLVKFGLKKLEISYNDPKTFIRSLGERGSFHWEDVILPRERPSDYENVWEFDDFDSCDRLYELQQEVRTSSGINDLEVSDAGK